MSFERDMDRKLDLNRREALVAGGTLCLGAAAPALRPKSNATVNGLVEKAIGRRRALRDGALPPVTPEIVGANLPLNSYEVTLEAAAQSAALAAQARKLGRHQLSEDDRDTLDCLIWDLERDAGYAPFYWHEFPLGYVGSELALLTFLSFPASPAVGEQAGFLQKVGQVPAYVDAIRGRLKGQLQRGLTPPRAEGVRAYDQFMVEAKEVAAVIHRSAEAVAAQPGGAPVAREAQRIADGALADAFERLRDTVRTDYVPALDGQAKVTRAVDAPEYFRELARLRISDDLGIEETYQHARDRLAVIDADLTRMRRRLGAPADAAAFHLSMVGDPRWYVRSADELKARLEIAITQVMPLVPRYFHSMPKTPFGLAPVPEALQTRLLNGIYLPPSDASPRGTYLYNTTRLDISNWAWTKPLVSHELMPGHHLQMALRLESKTLPPYRKSLHVPGYSEGWGEYARQLMEEAGFYEGDPWGLYASRLVERRFVLRAAVEAGVHEPGWTWQKADAELATDPLTRPGTTQQIALSAATFRSTGLQYWWGMRRFLGLRRLAQSRAGLRFDIRDFHSLVTRGDLVPFAVAERRVRDFTPGRV
jgi:uncharacterized protein (DUF885 family)